MQDELTRRDFLRVGTTAAFASGLAAGSARAERAQSSSQRYEVEVPDTLELSSIKISGELDLRIRLALRSLLAIRKRVFDAEGHTQGWGEDGSGRWIEAVALMRSYTGKPIPELDAAVVKLINFPDALQNGYLTSPLNAGGWWGHGKAIVGLVQYSEGRRDTEALRLATRLGDYALSNFPLKKPCSTFNGGEIDALVALWQATGNSKYLELAEQIPNLIDPGFGVPGGTTGAVHTHTFLASTHACVDLYLATGEKEYLQRAEDLWDRAVEHNMWVSGGISEVSTYPFETNDEACSVADWLRLSLKLGRATGNAKYMDVAEHTLLNHLYFDQDCSGGFCTYRSIEKEATPHIRDVIAWFCCSMNGSVALLDAARYAYTYDASGIDVNLFIASQATIPFKNQAVRLRQITTYPAQPAVRIEVQTQDEIPFRLGIRIPEWSRGFSLKLNGAPLHTQPTNGYVQIQRVWKSRDLVDVEFSPSLRLVPRGLNGFPASSQKLPITGTEKLERAALRYGPLVLMVDPTLQVHQMYNWNQIEILLPQGEDGEIFLPKASIPIPGRSDFSVSGMCFMTLGRNCEEGQQQPASVLDKSWKLVYLVPISEVTDRLTSTASRTVPYEVRNDMRLLNKTESSELLTRVGSEFKSYVAAMKSSTTPYRILLIEQGLDRSEPA